MANVRSTAELWLELRGNFLKEIQSANKEVNDLKHNIRTATDPAQISKFKAQLVGAERKIKDINQAIKDGDKEALSSIDKKDKATKNSLKEELKLRDDVHKKIMSDTQDEGKLQKIIDDEEKRRNQEIAREKAQQVAQEKRDQKELEQLARQRTQEEKRQQQELLRQDRERLQVYKELGNTMKSVGSAISGLGTSMIGVGVGTAGAITGASNKYVDTFMDLSRAVAVKNKSELGSTTISDWIDLSLNQSKKTGLDLKDVNQFLEMSLNATSPYYAAKNLDLFSRLGYVTGASGEALGIMNAIYGNRLHNNWDSIEQFGDALVAYSDLGGAGQDEMLESLSRVSNYTANFDDNDKYFAMQMLAVMSRMLPGSQGLSTGETAIRQMATDSLKKDLGGTVRQMAKAHGLSLDAYAKQFLGVDLKGNQLLSQNDLFRADYGRILAMTIKDIMSIEGAQFKKNEKTGETELITSKEIQSDLLKSIAANTKSLTAIQGMIAAIENGTWDKVRNELNDEAIVGRLDEGEKALNNSPIGKLKKSLNSLSVSFMQLISKLAPIMAGFMERMVEWVDLLGIGNMDFEELFETGKKLADVMADLVTFGIGLFVVGKVITLFGNLLLWTSNIITMFSVMELAGLNLTKNGTKLFSAFATGVVNSGNGIALGAKTTASSFVYLAGEAIVLAGIFTILFGVIRDFVSTLQEFGKSDGYKKMKEDFYNGVESDEALLYEKVNGTAFGSAMFNIAEGNYGEALKDAGQGFINGGTALGASLGSLGFLAGPLGFATVPAGAFIGGLIAPTDAAVKAMNGQQVDYENNPYMKVWGYGDYKAYQDNYKEQIDMYKEHKGEYEYKPSDKTQELLDQLPTPEDFNIAFNPDQTYDINDLEGLIEDGTAKGTEKGVKNALQGHFNTPDTYNILGQVGLGQLNQYEGFGIKKQGNQTVVNNNNVSIHIDGGNPEEIKRAIEDLFGGTGALSGATSYAYN